MQQQLDGAMRRNLFLLACCQAIGQAGNTMMFTATALSVVTFLTGANSRHCRSPCSISASCSRSSRPALLMQRLRPQLRLPHRLHRSAWLGASVVRPRPLYRAPSWLMCLGGLILGYRRRQPADVPLRRGRTGAAGLPRQGDLLGHRRRRRRRLHRAEPGAHSPTTRWCRSTWRPTPRWSASTSSSSSSCPSSVPVDARRRPWQRRRRRSRRRGRCGDRLPAALLRPVVTAMAAFGTMSFLMSASPLAIVACGLPHTEAHWVIFLHVMGMFVPAVLHRQPDHPLRRHQCHGRRHPDPAAPASPPGCWA